MSEFFDALEKAKHIGEVIAGNISPEGSNDLLQKGKAANIGETREWSGKKYRKQANGKWLEVSEHGKTKSEHITERNKWMESDSNYKKNHSVQGKLSDKEHSDEEVGLGKKEEHKPQKVERFKPNGWATPEFLVHLTKNVKKIWPTKNFNEYTGVQVRQVGSPDAKYISVSGKNSAGVQVQIADAYLDGSGTNFGSHQVQTSKGIKEVVENFGK